MDAKTKQKAESLEMKEIEIIETGWEWDVAACGAAISNSESRMANDDRRGFAGGETEGNDSQFGICDSQLREAEAEACGSASFAFDLVAGAMWLLMLAGLVGGAVAGIIQ